MTGPSHERQHDELERLEAIDLILGQGTPAFEVLLSLTGPPPAKLPAPQSVVRLQQETGITGRFRQQKKLIAERHHLGAFDSFPGNRC